MSILSEEDRFKGSYEYMRALISSNPFISETHFQTDTLFPRLLVSQSVLSVHLVCPPRFPDTNVDLREGL